MREIFFAGPIADYAAQSKLCENFCVQLTVAFGRPTFGTPTAARIQHEEALNVALFEFPGDPGFIVRVNCDRKSRWGFLGARGFGQGEIVLHFVRTARIMAFGVKPGGETFAGVGALKPDAAWGSGNKGEQRGFV